MSRNYKTVGIVTRRIKIGEADAIVFVISEEYGLIRLKARGFRKIRSKLAGFLQTLNLVKLEIAQGKGSLDTICSVETLKTYPKIKNSLIKVAFAFYVLENYLSIVGEAQEKKAFQVLVDSLEFLNDISSFKNVDRLFYIWLTINLLNYSGQSMEFHRCSRCKIKLLDKVLFSPEVGGTICKSCAKNVTIAFDISKNGVKLLRLLNQLSLPEIKKIKVRGFDLERTYLVVSSYSEYFIDYRLNSREFYDDVRKRA